MRISIVFLLFLFMLACKKETDAPTTVLEERPDSTAVVVATGQFQDGPFGRVSGKAALVKNPDDSYAIVLDSFSTSNGPDLYVYLSKQPMPVDFIEAGKLRSTNGKQVYNIAARSDINTYRYVSIHCKAYNHLFGYAMLP